MLVIAILFFCCNAFAEDREHPGANATNCSVSVNGDVQNSTIIACASPEVLDQLVRQGMKTLRDLTDSQKDTIALLKDRLKLNEEQLKSALRILGVNNVPPDKLAPTLVEISKRIRELEAGRSDVVVMNSPDVERLIDEAIRSGNLSKADMLLSSQEGSLKTRMQAEKAHILGDRGRIAFARLQYEKAAHLFSEALQALPEEEAYASLRIKYIKNEADCRFIIGEASNEITSLRTAEYLYRKIIFFRETSDLDRLDQARRLGMTLQLLGRLTKNKDKLNEAIAAYRLALWGDDEAKLVSLLVLPASRLVTSEVRGYSPLAPLGYDPGPVWMGLGNTIVALGMLASDPALIERSLPLLEDAKKAMRPWWGASVNWGMAVNNLAQALAVLGELRHDPQRLQQAIDNFSDALTAFNAVQNPREWKTTNANLALAQRALDRMRTEQRLEGTTPSWLDTIQPLVSSVR
jgi:tetratricopeptide (TPR) repeat protein